MKFVFWRRAQFLLLTVVASYLSLVPKPGAVFEQSPDKFLHVLCWGVLLVSLRVALGRSSWQWRAAFALFGYSVLVEAGQSWVPNRFFSGMDIVANATGILIGWSLVALYQHWSGPVVAAAEVDGNQR